MLQPRENPALFGHAAAEAAFARAAGSDRLPHAWLLTGPPGIGKATLAFRLARRVLAGPAPVDDPNDPSCALFRRIAHGSEPDLFVLENEADRRTGKQRTEIVIGQARDLTAGLHETAVGRHGRVVVVDAADDLNTNTVNALLKLIEEPPSGVVVLLVCHAPGRIPRTIVSRCVRLALRPLEDTAFRHALAAAGIAADPPAALVGLARGAPGRFLALAEAGFLDHYALTLAAIHGTRQDLTGAAEHLATLAAKSGAALATEVLATILRRGAEQAATGALQPALVETEERCLGALTARQPLDRWLAMWDKLQRLPFELEQLRVDPRQAFYLALAALAGADLAGEPPGPAVV